ncbi:MAG TPA: hypothetical protein VF559_02945 [Caulobacteraceae bacterium]|jgi:hypothetical protein
MKTAAIAVFAVFALASAASAEEENHRRPAPPPGAVTAVEDDSPGHLFAACLAEAAGARRYDRFGERYLRFTCRGETARTFYFALADYVAEEKTEARAGTRTLRFTEPGKGGAEERDLCWYDSVADRDAFGCRLILPAGRFLNESMLGD